ncbi:MAG: hypothetical protein UR31_C0001G0022 [Parcubacteria group bacterium GW2011_GWA2_33_14]|uniref:Tryptophan synthase beta chain-like PALP domain-containing protein n=1 Tax=Candidatus Staskawiczbacteria bacterium RIFCSPHIGHO2_02_FULL_33_16 TaxID=1802204 RepID=A0A1G2HUC8_9BACT|nr:MAG: hypothetical protein UR31_C0001G0022 [Parcubacteria group bacterium GW2011_GWA2_33_14]OGZ66067.1 MAG: hypothetical protein A3D34_02705 [Candidatus Staskawiczbacteria bacterium RIFCSPHIGHO2_02_FULL_33_16]OGZ70818.1 MAG: hypothetical protein A2980_02195 [Candidatus Staskawiczbacteria bacterium RIFCSPLOWO2_01_FULL_33_13]
MISLKEDQILKSIIVASENDPNKPEFPSDDPKFPATPTYKIEVPGFLNVWIKDESQNPTGTHKDRMAWEIIVTYRDILLTNKNGQAKTKLPQMSIISSGSAALAIQTQLKKYGLPNLKVLMDYNANLEIIKKLEEIGCKVYKTDLIKKPLDYRAILQLTNNLNGFDITSNEALDPTNRFYDWLSYEIINNSPDYCFIPFGTGNLYENILNINKKEITTNNHDPRFSGNVENLKECNFLGITTNNPKSIADKLYSPHLPFVRYDEQWIKMYRYAGYCGKKSNVYLLKEKFLQSAMKIAENQKISCEPSGIVGLALMLQMRNTLPKDKKMLIINTGKSKF